MIVMFSAGRLKPGAWEQFRRAWDPGEEPPPGFMRAYHARNIRDEDEVADVQENQRGDRRSAFVENDHVCAVYDVIDVVEE